MFMGQRIESYFLRRNDEPKLRIGANADQLPGCERAGGFPFLVLPPYGAGTQFGEYLPVRIHEWKQYLRTASNLECGGA